jgi:hypothetical protein
MIEKKIKLPCGHELEVHEVAGCFQAIVSTDRVPDNLGIRVSTDGQSAVLYVRPENLPVLRDLLIELAPLPKSHEIFGKNVRNLFKFLKGGKSNDETNRS